MTKFVQLLARMHPSPPTTPVPAPRRALSTIITPSGGAFLRGSDRRFRPVLALALILCANATLAGDLVFGLGQSGIDSSRQSETTAVQLEYHTGAIRSYSKVSVAAMGVLEYHSGEDVFAGAGPSLLLDIAPKWFVETSFAAGFYYASNDEVDLGGSLQFRSLLGAGYRLSNTSRLTIAINHLSNAGLDDTNPGRNTVSIRYARSF